MKMKMFSINKVEFRLLSLKKLLDFKEMEDIKVQRMKSRLFPNKTLSSITVKKYNEKLCQFL